MIKREGTELEEVDIILDEASEVSDSTIDCIFLEHNIAPTQIEEGVNSTFDSIMQVQCLSQCIPQCFKRSFHVNDQSKLVFYIQSVHLNRGNLWRPQ